jgi:uncharacterized protein
LEVVAVSSRVLVAESVIEETDTGPRLKGSRCVTCGTHAFPSQKSCQRCAGTETEEVLLANEGTLWTFTIQGFPPKAPPFRGDADPATFVPFGVGYVELPGEVKVETRLTESDPAKLRIGMAMRMVLDVIGTDEQGNEIVTYAFAPAGD